MDNSKIRLNVVIWTGLLATAALLLINYFWGLPR